MSLRKTVIILIIPAMIVIALWYAEISLNKYTETDVITASYFDNQEAVIDNDVMMNLIYRDGICDVDMWSYDNITWSENKSRDSITVLNHLGKSVVSTEIESKSKSSKISKSISKELYNSKKVSNEQLIIDNEVYLINGVISEVEAEKIKYFMDTDNYIVVDGDLSEEDNFKKWHIRITGPSKDMEREKIILRGYGIDHIKSDKDSATSILKMVSLVRIVLFWVLVCVLIYSILKSAVDIAVSALHKRSV